MQSFWRNSLLLLTSSLTACTLFSCQDLNENGIETGDPAGGSSADLGGSSGGPNKGGAGGSNSGEAGSPGSIGGAGGPGGSSGNFGSGGEETFPSIPEACIQCINTNCLNCSEGNPSCGFCTDTPALCKNEPLQEGQLRECSCNDSCATLCNTSSLCDSSGGIPPQGCGSEGGSGGGDCDIGPEENCQNGIDDNDDNLIDCDDPKCNLQCVNPCLAPQEITLSPKNPILSVNGSWKGHTAAFQQDCFKGEIKGPDIAYLIKNNSSEGAFIKVTAVADTPSSANIILSSRTLCMAGSQDIPCKDALGEGGAEEMTQFVEPGASFVVIVGAVQPGSSGSFKLTAELSLSQCGDGKKTPDEACDDPKDPNCKDCKITACLDTSPIKDGETVLVTKKDAKTSSALIPSCSKLGENPTSSIHSIRTAKTGWFQAILRSKEEPDQTLSLWSSCDKDSEITCADSAPGGVGSLERIVKPVSAGEMNYLVVGSYSGTELSDYKLFAETFPAVCGDKIISPVEQCDGDDSCDANCTRKLDSLDEIEPNNTISQATLLKSASSSGKKITFRAKIQKSGDRDIFRIVVEKSGTLEIATNDPGDGSCWRNDFSVMPQGILDSALHLFTADGVILASNDNGKLDGFCSRISFPVQAGTYWIEVSAAPSAPSQVFSYLLDVAFP